MKTLLLFLLPFWVVAQESILPQPVTQTKPQSIGRRWTASFTFPDWPVLGTATAIKQQMKEMGWASSVPAGCFFIFCSGPSEYPTMDRYPSFDLEVGYRQTKRYGYQVSFGSPETAVIEGRTPGGSYLTLKSKVWYTSMRWAWYSRNGRFVNSIGPALLFVQDYDQFGQQVRHNQTRPGFHVSSQFRFFDRRTWLLAVKMDIRSGLPATTQEYEKTEIVYNNKAASTSKSVRFAAINLPSTYVNVGVQLGIKIL